MFDDIINDRRRWKEYIAKEICPFCNSLNIEQINGVFKHSSAFIVTYRCIDCKKLWHATYDASLAIVDVGNGA